MSAIRLDTTNINIPAGEIAKEITATKKYDNLSNEEIEKITNTIMDKVQNALSKSANNGGVLLDDEDLFDEIYDYMLNQMGESFSTADVASFVNDVFMQAEDILFDDGRLEYQS